ncbi:50S ribosomal protein L35 [Candidatus Riflebacteria bacterium]
MPNIKTHSGAKKRFVRLRSGKIRRRKAFKSHILTKKTRKRKREFRKPCFISKSDMNRITKLLPGK